RRRTCPRCGRRRDERSDGDGQRRGDPRRRARAALIVELDPVFLSRMQFAFVIAFHILLPAFTVGLASFIVLLEGLHVVKRNPLYLRLSVFWTRIFAVSFGMGVVSGIVMPF